jgi:hypothetical protein
MSQHTAVEYRFISHFCADSILMEARSTRLRTRSPVLSVSFSSGLCYNVLDDAAFTDSQNQYVTRREKQMTEIVRSPSAAIAIAIFLAATLVSLPKVRAEEALTANDIFGRWCGTVLDYEITPTMLTVTFHSNGRKRVLQIDKLNVGKTWIELVWKEGGNTAFAEFSADKTKMAQAKNAAGYGPRREFHRC